MDIVVAYDISTSTSAGVRRLARVAAICEGYGIRVQKSVFECQLDNTRFARLITELQDAIEPTVDSVRCYRVAGPLDDARTTLGQDRPWELGTTWIV